MPTPTRTTREPKKSASGARQERESTIGTRCRSDCKTPSPAQAHCSVCHASFGGVSGFDGHRRDGQCLNPANLGMVERDGVWRTPLSDDQAARLRALKER